MTGVISPPDMIKNPKPGVYTLGPLIIQVMNINVPWRKVTLFNYNMPFPNGVIAVFGQGSHMGQTGTAEVYTVPISFQVGGVNNSQYRCCVSSDVKDAALVASIIAIGF